ncbi:MAG: carbamoyltransferase HypF [Desulfobacteraceae bacterium]|jgi:hydrogenase maturation protein HypF
MTSTPSAITIHVNGIVQGVGFRPFVYQLARQMDLTGRVANTASGVAIHAEGPVGQLDRFVENLKTRKPVLAHIVSVDAKAAEVAGYNQFEITKSQGAETRATLISPDVCMCADCRAELFDPNDRRFGYPFINCTNCGPRYTIIDDIPYDRPKTSMRHFTMCDRCQAEYDDPANRRFHAQPNACAQCGPRVSLYDNRRRLLASADAIAQTADLLKAGHIVAVKGLGGYHLAVDATNDTAVEQLRIRKHREEKPLAVMSADLASIEAYAQITPSEAELLTSIQRPIVLLQKKMPEKLAFSVSPRNRYYGVMLPYTPLHELLLAHGFIALVMTSGNLSEEPIAIDNEEAFQRLGQIADYFLNHDRQIYLRSDDSIVRHAAGKTRPIRRSRGFVPIPVFLNAKVPQVLACGAELKNTICLTRGSQAFVSQHIGDLENLATEKFFRMTVDHLQRILDITPEIIACDRHPDYLSTQWAVSRSDHPLIQVQHHHAHVAACMAEHQLDGPVIGLAFDGAGLGADQTVWGGEVLVADYGGYRRVAHLTAVPMPGAAAAIKAPWRMALAYLDHAFGDSLWDVDLPLMRRVDRAQAQIVAQMCAQGVNAPLTSSMGRLFDAVAAILGLRLDAAFEGQAAMELEMIADSDEKERYDFTWDAADAKQVAVAPIVAGVVEDLRRGLPAFIISAKFHNTIIEGFSMLCQALRKENRINQVVLSGGCFQNRRLLEGLRNRLKTNGFEVFCHRQVPTNDGGIALGQAMIAAATASAQPTKPKEL